MERRSRCTATATPAVLVQHLQCLCLLYVPLCAFVYLVTGVPPVAVSICLPRLDCPGHGGLPVSRLCHGRGGVPPVGPQQPGQGPPRLPRLHRAAVIVRRWRAPRAVPPPGVEQRRRVVHAGRGGAGVQPRGRQRGPARHVRALRRTVLLVLHGGGAAAEAVLRADHGRRGQRSRGLQRPQHRVACGGCAGGGQCPNRRRDRDSRRHRYCGSRRHRARGCAVRGVGHGRTRRRAGVPCRPRACAVRRHRCDAAGDDGAAAT